MEVREANTLGIELIELGSFDDGVAVAAQIAVPLIVREYQNDVRRLAIFFLRPDGRGEDGRHHRGGEEQAGQSSLIHSSGLLVSGTDQYYLVSERPIKR